MRQHKREDWSVRLYDHYVACTFGNGVYSLDFAARDGSEAVRIFHDLAPTLRHFAPGRPSTDEFANAIEALENMELEDES